MKTTTALKIKDTAVIVNNPFEKMAQSWFEYNCDKAPTTLRAYAKSLQSFFAWLADNQITQVTRKDFIGYRAYLVANFSASTAKLRIAAVKVFAGWLASEGLYKNFTAGVRSVKDDEAEEYHVREALQLDEARAVLRSFKGDTEKALRDAVIMRLMIGSGLRSCEIVRLDTADLERRGKKFFLCVLGKGRSAKQKVEISKAAYDQLINYLNKRGATFKKGSPMFTSTANRNRGRRLQVQSISRLAKKTFRACGIDSSTLTCHSCRHSFATLLLKNGVDVRRVSKLLRHKSLRVTERYSHDLDREKDSSIEDLSLLLDA